MVIAVDAMGGDHAPEPVVKGALAAATQIQGEIILVGDENQIRPFAPHLPPNVTIHHATQVIGMDEKPAESIRKKKDASIVVAARLVKEGRAQALVSAGNTGAATAASLLAWRTIPGVHRPAIAQVFPTHTGKFLLLDAGASPDVDPVHLTEFALMGLTYANRVMHKKDPSVYLLNIGEEPGKGNNFAKESFAQLEKFAWFKGNIEAKDLFRRNDVDVVVCDAFVGNIMLKACEGVGEFILDEIRAAVPGWPLKALFFPLKWALSPLRSKVDYAEYGGSPLLGLNGLCLISHGRSNARAMEVAILNAAESIRANLVETIRESFAPVGQDQVI